MDFPTFSSENRKFWQACSEDYFAIFDTDPELWIAVEAMQFEGEAAQWMSSLWMSSVHHRFSRASWDEFCTVVLHRFGKINIKL
jgi:hypothetical protein